FAKDRRGLLVHKERSITIENGRSVLHAAPLIVRDGQHVELSERVFDSVPLVVEMDGLHGGFKRELAILLFVGLGADADRRAINSALQTLPVADCERHK